MDNPDLVTTFLRSTDDWLCDGYFLDVRYVATRASSGLEIFSASLLLNPLPPHRSDLGFHTSGTRFVIGQRQVAACRKTLLKQVVSQAISGVIHAAKQPLQLVRDPAIDFYSEMAFRERWYSELHLQVIGARRPEVSILDLATADSELRLSNPPFDGLTDACNWLGLAAPGSNSQANSIHIRVRPPVDLIFDECQLSSDTLTITLNAHPKFDVSRVRLAVRAAPGDGILGRQQIASAINWHKPKAGRRAGVVQVKLPHADSALAMLMIEGSTVRRQWFNDPAKARNNRYLAVQHFDNELRMVRQAVMESTDSVRFEHGIAALLFLLGFTSSVQLETNAPDLIVTTPGGRLTLVECTTRTSDFAAKLGKLVDRRGGLSKHLASNGHLDEVNAVLVCRLPLDQLPAQTVEAARNKVLLVTTEGLVAAFDRVRFPDDPDKVLNDVAARLAS